MGGWSDSLATTTASAEIYTPATGTFALVADRAGKPASMADSRLDAAVALLPGNNRVLVVGGQRQDETSGGRPVSVDRAELYSEE